MGGVGVLCRTCCEGGGGREFMFPEKLDMVSRALFWGQYQSDFDSKEEDNRVTYLEPSTWVVL